MSVKQMVRDQLVTGIQSLPRRARMYMGGVSLETEKVELSSTAGYKIAAEIHKPVGHGQFPGVLLCPGTNDPGTVFNTWSQPVNASELAGMGLVVMSFDPAGRGDSWGPEDYGGPEHQDNLRVALHHLLNHSAVLSDNVGVVAISLGISMACGALAQLGGEGDVRWLIDWEGPSDREIITSHGTIMIPTLGHKMDDEVYWRPREAVRHLSSLQCGYVRIQSNHDHAQGTSLFHFERMVEVLKGTHELAWFQINDHKRNEVPASFEWVEKGRSAANKAILKKVEELSL